MNNNKSFFEEFKKVTLIFIIVFFILYLLFNGIIHYIDYKNKVRSLKNKYIEDKKYEVKREVLYAVEYIKSELINFNIMMKDRLKDEIYHLHRMFDIVKSSKRLYNNKRSFFEKFLTELDESKEGVFYFLIDKRDKNFYSNIDIFKEDKAVLNKIISMFETNKKDEDSFDFLLGKDKKSKYKIYVKYYKPFDIFIGVIIDESKYFEKLKSKILNVLADIRFGKEGYIFINQFDGVALVSNGKCFYGQNKKLWEILIDYPLKDVKEVFNKEIKAAQKDSGDFIFYSWVKLTDLNKVSNKVSFIYGIKELQWIVGAGIYLDDINKEIALLESNTRQDLFINFIIIIFIIFSLIGSIFFVFNKINKKLKNHFDVFISFFNSAAFMNKEINGEKMEYIEFKEMSKYANKMVYDNKNYQEKLFNEREKLMITLKSIGDAVVVTNANGEIEFLNREAEKLLGVNLIDVKNHKFKKFCKLISSKSNRKLDYPVELVLKTKKMVYVGGDVVLVSNNGKRYNITDSAAPILDKENNIIGVVIVFRNITEQLKMEKEIAKNEKLEAIGILAGGIAHDFNNMLTGIFGNIELANLNLSSGKMEEVKKFLDISLDTLERTRHLTKQLLIFSKGGEPVLESLDLKYIITNIAKFNLSGSNIGLHISIADDIWYIKADEGQLGSVLSNIIINAKQAMEKAGSIYIRAYNVKDISKINPDYFGKYICIEIEDEGPGIAPELIDKIFDPYFTTKDKGHGLGLAVAHSIIKRHKGFINVKSELGKGTIFYIYLPADMSREAKEKEIRNTDDFIFEGNVLIMDDVDVVGEVAREMLNILGFHVDIVSNCKDAIEMYKKSAYDLVILDLTIPGELGGEEVAREILKINPEAKIVVASGYSSSPILANYKKYGFIDRIEKPFNYDELKKLVIRIFKNK